MIRPARPLSVKIDGAAIAVVCLACRVEVVRIETPAAWQALARAVAFHACARRTG